MYVMSNRRLRNLETPRQLRRSRRSARQYRGDRVPCCVTQGAENRLGVYRANFFRPRITRAFLLLENSVRGFRVRRDREIQGNPPCARLVFRPPSPPIERGRNHIASVDPVVSDG